MFRITIQPFGRTIYAGDSHTLAYLAARSGIPLTVTCGGNGTCGKCRVRILSGEVKDAHSAHRLSPQDLAQGWRLACGCKPASDLTIEIPATSILGTQEQVILKDHAGGYKLATTLSISSNTNLALAFDLGTTTIVGALIDLDTHTVRETCGEMNGQIIHGDDVIARLQQIREGAVSLAAMQSKAVASMNTITGHLCRLCGTEPEAIKKIVFAGNTAMQQTLLGIDSFGLTEHPFAPRFRYAMRTTAGALGLHADPNASVMSFPQIGGFVGGDTVAGMLAADFDEFTQPALLIDIGTNGEVALCNEGRIYCASTAAGPAFEGASISQGMRAMSGAIDKVWVQDYDIAISIIGKRRPIGLCGSALIDAAAELLRLSILDPSGLLCEPDAIGHAIPAPIKRRMLPDGFVLAWQQDGATPAVTLTQSDIAELQKAVAALRAGTQLLLKQAGLADYDLSAVLLAGAFGSNLNRENARRIGLLPVVAPEQIHFLGNASLAGAEMLLLQPAAEARAEALREKSTHVNLAEDPAFSDTYTDALIFPEH